MANAQDYQEILWTGRDLHFEWQENARVSGEALWGGENEELSLSFPAPCSRIFVLLACDFS